MALFFVGLLGLCGGGVWAEPPAAGNAPKLKPGIWVILGSSTAAGAGASPGNSWADRLRPEASAQGGRVVNLAKGGTVTHQGLPATTASAPGRPLPDPALNIDQALALDPALVFLAYPTNDTAHGYAVEETVENLLAMRRQALARAVPVIVLSTQPRRLSEGQLARLALIDERLAAAIGDCFVAVRAPLAAADGHLAVRYDAGDGVHLNDAGHRLIASRISLVLEGGKCVELSAAGQAPPKIFH